MAEAKLVTWWCLFEATTESTSFHMVHQGRRRQREARGTWDASWCGVMVWLWQEEDLGFPLCFRCSFLVVQENWISWYCNSMPSGMSLNPWDSVSLSVPHGVSVVSLVWNPK